MRIQVRVVETLEAFEQVHIFEFVQHERGRPGSGGVPHVRIRIDVLVALIVKLREIHTDAAESKDEIHSKRGQIQLRTVPFQPWPRVASLPARGLPFPAID